MDNKEEKFFEEKETDDDSILKEEVKEEKEKEKEYTKIKEDKNIRKKINYHNDDKKKIILIILVAIILIGTVVFLLLNKKDNVKDNTKEKDKEVVEIKEDDSNKKMIGYVSCDDNKASLNVRNSIDGDIIDSLSCYKEVTIEEKQEKSENCDQWYKISYIKNGSNYTGYACGSYIKDRTVSDKTIKQVKELVDKVNNYYEKVQVLPYCGKTSDSKIVTFKEKDEDFEGKYVKSEYKTIEDVKNYLLTFMDESLIKNKLSLSDYNNPKMYDDYYEIDGNLYCRDYSGKGFISSYTGEYNIEIISETDDKITGNIAYEYINNETLENEESKCNINNLSLCNNSNFEYKLSKISIDKKNDNFVVTKIDFHE